MEKLEENEKVYDEIINSLNGMGRVEAPAFFYTRLMARIEKEVNPPSWIEQIMGVLTRPAFAIVTLSFFILLNVAAITSMLKGKQPASTSDSSTGASLQSFAQEYDLSVSTLYTDSKGN